jgi:hypothetical protein
MPYILFKTDGTQLTTVGDASLDTTTDLQFVGRNYSGYGQIVNENFVKVLENFASTTAPTRPVVGQLWYDTVLGRINVNYNSKNFKSLANVHIGEETDPPSSATTQEGDFWWDSTNGQLKAKHGSQYILVGPPSASNTKSAWVPTEETWLDDESQEQLSRVPFLEANIGTNSIVVISNQEFRPTSGSTLYGSFPKVYKGITLPGAVDGIPGTTNAGSTQDSKFYFWGTAADALQANTSTTATIAMQVSVGLEETSNDNHYISFVSTSSGNHQVLTSSNISYNPSSQVLNATATSARYADLAERYESDAVYEVGTVLIVGGTKEVTTTDIPGHDIIAGIVSQNPAYMMNSEAGNDETHPYIALKGRVPCKVVGKVQKGDKLVTSNVPGHAMSSGRRIVTSPTSIIGIALESREQDGAGIIEVKV